MNYSFLSPSLSAASPFGVAPSLNEGPTWSWLSPYQSELYQNLLHFIGSAKTSNTAFITLCAIAFAYGFIHAVGPGHSKLAISSYLLAQKAKIRLGIMLSLAAALLQSLVAIIAVYALYFIFSSTAKQATQTAQMLEKASASVLILLGFWLLFKKIRALTHTHSDHCDCEHVIIPTQKTSFLTVLAAGLRPCSGAILLLTLAASQDIFFKGAISILFMGLGTSLALVLLALFTIYFRQKAEALSQKGSRWGQNLITGLELVACLVIITLGIFMLNL